jgi:hypothetical protein
VSEGEGNSDAPRVSPGTLWRRPTSAGTRSPAAPAETPLPGVVMETWIPRPAPCAALSTNKTEREEVMSFAKTAPPEGNRNRDHEEQEVTQAPTNRESLHDPFETAKEYVDYGVCDPLGQKIGTVQDIFMNAFGEPEYITVKMGFLGLRSVLLPVQSIAVDKEQRILGLQ